MLYARMEQAMKLLAAKNIIAGLLYFVVALFYSPDASTHDQITSVVGALLVPTIGLLWKATKNIILIKEKTDKLDPDKLTLLWEDYQIRKKTDDEFRQFVLESLNKLGQQ